MNFERLAINALERGEATRALFLLVEGFKRHEGSDEALRLMLRLYLEQTRTPGLEQDVVSIIQHHPDGGFWLAQLLDAFEEDGQPRMAEALLLAATKIGLRPVVPPEALLRAGQPPEDAFDIVEIEDAADDDGSAAHEAAALAFADEAIITLDEPRDPDTLIPYAKGASRSSESLLSVSVDGLATGEALAPVEDLDAPLALDVAAPADEASREDDASLVDDASSTSWPDRRAKLVMREAPEPTLEQAEPPEQDAQLSLAEVHQLRAEQDPQSSDANPRKSRLRAAGFAGAMVFFLALVVWSWWSSHSGVDALDHHLERLDPLNAQPFERALDQAAQRFGVDEADISERRAFVDALLATWLKAPPSAHKLGPDPKTPWGLATLAFQAVEDGNLERAIMHVTALEHRWPDRLPSLWARGHLEERRGRYEEAVRAYMRAQERYPQFVSGTLARLRMAVERDDELRWRDAREQLSKLHSVHAYLHIKPDETLQEQDFISARRAPYQPQQQPGLTTAQDRFLLAREHYQQAALAWRRGDLKSAEAANQLAVSLAPRWFDAKLLELALHAAQGDGPKATTLALEQAARQDLSPRARLRLMTIAPYVLTLAGDAADALILTFDPGLGPSRRDWLKRLDEPTRQKLQQRRPAPLSLSPSQWRGYPAQVGLAGYSWAYALFEGGHAETALEVLRWLEDQQQLNGQGRLLRVWILLHQQRRHDYQSALESLRDAPEGYLARAATFLIEGHTDRALEQLLAAPDTTLDLTIGLRVHLAIRLAKRQVDEADAVLKAQPWSLSHLPAVRVLRRRVEAMRSPEQDSAPAKPNAQSLLYGEPTAMSYMVDLGYEALYLGELERAKRWAERVLVMERQHPAAHQLLGLIYQHNRQHHKAKTHLSLSLGVDAAAEDAPDAQKYRQRGFVYLELGHYEQARQFLYKAMLTDRYDLQALKGLARVYLAHDVALGQREFERFVQGYSDRQDFKAQRGEALKWLGVLHGSREGKPEGLAYLRRAEREVGPRGDLLYELAEHHRALRQARQARALYIAALQADTTLAVAHLGLAKLALESKETSQAREHLSRFIELEPFGREAKWAQRTLLQMKAL